MARAKELTPNITQVGIRSTAREELHNIDTKRTFYAHRIAEDDEWQERVSTQLGDEVYITIDLDVFDPAYLPSTGTPEPGGLTYREVMGLLKRIVREHRVVGIDIVELCPNPMAKASDFLAAKLIYQFLSELYAEPPKG